MRMLEGLVLKLQEELQLLQGSQEQVLSAHTALHAVCAARPWCTHTTPHALHVLPATGACRAAMQHGVHVNPILCSCASGGIKGVVCTAVPVPNRLYRQHGAHANPILCSCASGGIKGVVCAAVPVPNRSYMQPKQQRSAGVHCGRDVGGQRGIIA